MKTLVWRVPVVVSGDVDSIEIKLQGKLAAE
jgi:hypothetical protein